MSKRKAKPVAKLARKRTPGLDGTFDGTCVGCLRPTDTALGVRGDPEWHAAFLVRLGLPLSEATSMVDAYTTGRDGMFRVCAKCATWKAARFRSSTKRSQ